MVVIIGATGFIGMYTTEAFLKAGKKVIATGRNEHLGETLKKMGASFVRLDVTCEQDFERLPTSDVEGVILLAGFLPANSTADLVSEENASDYFKVNVIGAINVLEYCRRSGIKNIIGNCSYSDVSSVWDKGYRITEEEPRSFSYKGDHAVYVISRNACNDVMEYYNQQHHLRCAWFRLSPVYGVGPHSVIYGNVKSYKSGIATWIENARVGKDIEIWVDKETSRDLIYVKDVARAYVMALASNKTYGLYNMTSGVGVTLQCQAETVIDVFGDGDYSHIKYRPDLPNHTSSFLFSMEKAKKDFGFVPEYTDYKKMMLDYKEELESGRWFALTEERKKL